MRARGRHTAIPYASVIYSEDGRTWAYVCPQPLRFVRVEIDVARIDGDEAVLAKGPPAGARVVTTGAAQVYGAEFEVGH